MSGYVDRNLHPGETVEYRGRYSWAAAFHRGIITLIVGFGLFAFAAAVRKTDASGEAIGISPWLSFLAVVAMVVGVVELVAGYIRRTAAEYAVTDQRVIGKYGLIRHQSVDVLITAISGVSVSSSIPGRLFGYGAVWINGTGTRRRLDYLSNPRAFQAAVYARLEVSRLLKGTAAYTLDVRIAPDERPVAVPPAGALAMTAPGGRFCSQCGSGIGAAGQFCDRCGAAVG